MNENLKQAVLEQLGFSEIDQDCKDTLSDICNYGIDGGFTGFIYYDDTCIFYDRNKKEILELLKFYASEFDITICEFIAGFNCLNLETQEVELFFINNDTENETQIKNALAWFACEEVARDIINNQ